MKLRPAQRALAHFALAALGVLFAAPFAWMLSTSLKTADRVQTDAASILPRASYVSDAEGRTVRVRPLMLKDGRREVQVDEGPRAGETMLVAPAAIQDRVHLHWANYADALATFPVSAYVRNTLVICALSIVGTALSCSLVAYGLAFIRWRGREPLFWTMLATMMLPPQVTLIPMFLTFRSLGWIDTILPLVVPTFLGNAFFIFLLRQFYRSIPTTLLEAARLDGCSDLRIWATIVLPLSRPALMVVVLFTFLGTWNDFLGPLTYLHDERRYTLSIALAQLQGQYGSDWGQMMALSLLMTLPVVVLFFFTQRSFIGGVKLGSVKE